MLSELESSTAPTSQSGGRVSLPPSQEPQDLDQQQQQPFIFHESMFNHLTEEQLQIALRSLTEPSLAAAAGLNTSSTPVPVLDPALVDWVHQNMQYLLPNRDMPSSGLGSFSVAGDDESILSDYPFDDQLTSTQDFTDTFGQSSPDHTDPLTESDEFMGTYSQPLPPKPKKLHRDLSLMDVNCPTQSNETYFAFDNERQISYKDMIIEAILSHPTKTATVSEIYDHIRSNYPQFCQCRANWQNSVRHNLSLQHNFAKVPRPPNMPGKGNLWRVIANHEQHDHLQRRQALRTLKKRRAHQRHLPLDRERIDAIKAAHIAALTQGHSYSVEDLYLSHPKHAALMQQHLVRHSPAHSLHRSQQAAQATLMALRSASMPAINYASAESDRDQLNQSPAQPPRSPSFSHLPQSFPNVFSPSSLSAPLSPIHPPSQSVKQMSGSPNSDPVTALLNSCLSSPLKFATALQELSDKQLSHKPNQSPSHKKKTVSSKLAQSWNSENFAPAFPSSPSNTVHYFD